MTGPLDRILRRGETAPAEPAVAAPAPPAAPAQSAYPATASLAGEGPGVAPSIDPAEERELRAQRDRLVEKFTVMQADLGGAFYEMAIRDHVRMDVLTRKAAELQRVDAELLAIERILKIERADAAGICPTCGTPYVHGVVFCSQCGNPVTQVQAAP